MTMLPCCMRNPLLAPGVQSMRQESSSSLGDRLAAAQAEVARLTEALRSASASADAATAAHTQALADRDARLASHQSASAAQLEEAKALASRQLQDAASAHEATVKVRPDASSPPFLHPNHPTRSRDGSRMQCRSSNVYLHAQACTSRFLCLPCTSTRLFTDPSLVCSPPPSPPLAPISSAIGRSPSPLTLSSSCGTFRGSCGSPRRS
jgi:hypothetical protein